MINIDKITKTVGKNVLYPVSKVYKPKTAKVASQGVQSLEHMPAKQDLVTMPNNVVSGASQYDSVANKIALRQLLQSSAKSIEKRLATYMRILPEGSKMLKPVEFEVAGTKYSILIDKKFDKYSNVSIKQLTPIVSDVEVPMSHLNATFDKTGKMLHGSLNLTYGSSSTMYRFIRKASNNMRRIEVVNSSEPRTISVYKPAAEQKYWSLVKECRPGQSYGARVGTLAPDDMSNSLGYLFFELLGVARKI